MNEEYQHSLSNISGRYDRLAETGDYDRFMADSPYAPFCAPYEQGLLERAPAGGELVILGCGSGRCASPFIPHFRVTGYDLSSRSLEIARRRFDGAGKARFVQRDIRDVALSPASVDAVAAPFSIFHLPRQEHAALLQRMARALRPGRAAWITMGATDRPAYTIDFLGQRLPYSHFDWETNRRLCAQAGLRVAREALISEQGDEVTVLGPAELEGLPPESFAVQFLLLVKE